MIIRKGVNAIKLKIKSATVYLLKIQNLFCFKLLKIERYVSEIFPNKINPIKKDHHPKRMVQKIWI